MHLCFTLLSAILLASCSSYHPIALDISTKMVPSLQALQLEMVADEHPELPKRWRIKKVIVNDGLDEVETIVLAVLNSPKLKSARTQLKTSSATLYAAGLLPDPQVSAAFDIPKHNNPSTTTGRSFALGIDLQQILTQGSRQTVATQQAKATYLRVLWQEWQVIQQARMLWRRALIQNQQTSVLQAQFSQTTATWKTQYEALKQGNTTLDQQGLALTPMMDAQAAFIESKRQLNITMHDLKLLLGVDPQGKIPLAKPEQGIASLIAKPLAPNQLHNLLATIATKRPDLLALQAGYNSQEGKVREQILLQFPSFSLGANQLRDTAGLWTLGPFINLNLPLLNGNKGNIAIARATRKRLAEEFHYQLTSAYVQASKMAADQYLAFNEWQALTTYLPQLASTVQRIAHALSTGKIDMLTFTTMRAAYFSQQARALTLEQMLLEQGIALETVTATLMSGHQSEKNNALPEAPL